MPAEITASMYQAKSATQSGKDYQMFPKTPNFNDTHNEVTTPTHKVIQERPNYVIINKAGQTYSFLYQTTGSIGGTTNETMQSGIKLTTDGPMTLPIQPHAWTATGSPAAGDVTFVYVRVR
tara:strand:- start:40 stop:402 length:363 start_codon:yes stop_codon:yes gene_type:complete